MEGRKITMNEALRLPPLKFFDVRPGVRLIVCYRCGSVVVDDDEGANRGDHEAWHDAVEPPTSPPQSEPEPVKAASARPDRCPCRTGYASNPGTHNNQVRAYGRCSCWCHGGQ